MNFGQAVVSVVTNSFNFSGRARRSEFWWWALMMNIILGAAWLVDQKLQTGLIVPLVMLVVFVPNLAVEVRRLHDLDATGWWVLASFVPFVGALGLGIWFCFPGTLGPNQYGPDPLQEPQGLSEKVQQ